LVDATPPPRALVALPRSLAEVSRSVPVGAAGFWRKLFAFAGPGYLVAVGYMDPGNWATDLAGGSRFGTSLLSVILLSNLMAIVLQALSAKLGICAGRDLAQACREHYPPAVSFALWVLCEVAIVACDLAEVIGTAIALKLLFGLPLVGGILLTALDVLLVLQLQRLGFRRLEAFILALLAVVAACFALELAFARPDPASVLAGLVPTPEIVRDPAMLYLAIGILGATVMPHNLYLHSAIVQTRRVARTDAAKREALRFATIDSTVALTFAMAINGAILVLAAATFHNSGETAVADIERAHELLAPTLGAPLAGVIFAIALLASGQNSTLTATLAGQIVMEGFLRVRLAPWLRRLATRLAAIVPAVAVALIYGEAGTGRLLILSQVILSLQLPFAVIPLVHFTGRRKTMGAFANPPWLQALAVGIAAALVLLNAKLVADALL
jgi:manganese transport protein